jgi:hypothetical protein
MFMRTSYSTVRLPNLSRVWGENSNTNMESVDGVHLPILDVLSGPLVLGPFAHSGLVYGRGDNLAASVGTESSLATTVMNSDSPNSFTDFDLASRESFVALRVARYDKPIEQD